MKPGNRLVCTLLVITAPIQFLFVRSVSRSQCTGTRCPKKHCFLNGEIREIDPLVTVQVSIGIRSKKQALQFRQVSKVDLVIIVQIRIAAIAEAIGVGVTLIRIDMQDAIVLTIQNAVTIAVTRQRQGIEIGRDPIGMLRIPIVTEYPLSGAWVIDQCVLIGEVDALQRATGVKGQVQPTSRSTAAASRSRFAGIPAKALSK